MSHYWGDEWFEKNGDDLNDAVDYIYTFCRRWGRLGGQAKEKYGTVRFYAKFHSLLQDLWTPGLCWNRWPKWVWWADIYIYGRYFVWLQSLIHRVQGFVYSRAYQNAVRKWPHLRYEILDCADYKELFPLALCREANRTWSRTPEAGDVIYYTSGWRYGMPRAIIHFDSRTKIFLYQQPNGGIGYFHYGHLVFRFWGGTKAE